MEAARWQHLVRGLLQRCYASAALQNPTNHRTRRLDHPLMLQPPSILRAVLTPCSLFRHAAVVTQLSLDQPWTNFLATHQRPAGGDKQPEDFHYTHLWVDSAGETHLKECSMKGFDLKQYAKGKGSSLLSHCACIRKVLTSSLRSICQWWAVCSLWT